MSDYTVGELQACSPLPIGTILDWADYWVSNIEEDIPRGWICRWHEWNYGCSGGISDETRAIGEAVYIGAMRVSYSEDGTMSDLSIEMLECARQAMMRPDQGIGKLREIATWFDSSKPIPSGWAALPGQDERIARGEGIWVGPADAVRRLEGKR